MSNTNIFNLTGVGSNVRFGKSGSRLKMNAGVLEVRNAADTGYADFKASNATFTSDVVVTGNLTVNGTTTTVNSTVITIKDPVINLGGGTDGVAPVAPDAFNRGVEFQWYDTAAHTGFFGWDNASGKFVYRPDGINLGTAAFNQLEAGDVTITGDTISNGSGDLTITPASDLILSSLSGTAALLFADANKKIKSTPILWDGTKLTVNNLTLAGNTIGVVSGSGNITLTPDAGSDVIVSSLTATRVVFAGANKELSGNSTFTFNNSTGLLSATAVTTTAGVTVGGDLTVSTLTAGQVPYVGTAGKIVNKSTFTFAASTDTLSATNVTSSGTADLATVKVSTLTAGRMTFAGANGLLSDSSTLTYDVGTDTVSLTNLAASSITNSALTAGRITFAGTAGLLADSASLLWDTATNKLTATNIKSSGTADLATVKVSTLTSGRVTYAGTAGQLSDASVFTFDSGTGTVQATNVTATALVKGQDVEVDTLTATRVVFSDADHKLVDAATLTYGAVAGLTIDQTNILGATVSTTAGDLVLAPAAGSNIDVSAARIINAADPTGAQDVATKNYVDSQIGAGAHVGDASVAQANVTQSIKGTIHRIKIYVTTAYSAGATISVSDGTNTLVATADVDAQTNGAYIVDMFQNYATATTITLAVDGSPASGAAEWLIEYFTTAG